MSTCVKTVGASSVWLFVADIFQFQVCHKLMTNFTVCSFALYN